MIALAMILKDTETLGMITRCLDSVAPYIDGIYLTITHTTKKPSEAAKDLEKQLAVYCVNKDYPEPKFSNFKWVKNFSKARNYNFSQISKEYEWAVWLDADDVLRGGQKLQDLAERMSKTDVKAVFFNYLYRVELGPDGGIRNVLIEHLRERLIKNDGSYKWIGPIHETLIEQRGTNKTDTKDLDVVHLTTDERGAAALDRNIEILETTLEKQGDKRDPRIVYYLSKTYFDKRTEESFKKAEDLIFQYLNGSEEGTASGWPEERAQAWEYLSEIYRERKQFNKAIKANANSLIEAPYFPQYYIDMALNYTYLRDWKKAKHWIRLSQQVPYPKTTLVMNPRDMQARTLEVIFNIAINTQDIKGAWAAASKLVEVFPDSKSVENRLKTMSAILEDNKVAKNLIETYQYLKKRGQIEKAQGLLEAIPTEVSTEPAILTLRREIMKPREWNDDEITIVCGRGFEKWSPKKIKDGLGGSEEAVIYNSRELAKLGWKITVYGDPEENMIEEFDDGWVKYVSHYEFNPEDSFNVLIGWRNIGFYDNDWDAKKTYLWLHDVQNPMEYTKDRVDRINKIFVLSEAHKKTIINEKNKEWLTDDKFLLTGNGINLEQFEIDKPERNNKRLIWTSSYDRGLEHLLDMWPDVLAEVPEAELHIFYGWNLFNSIHKGNPERMAWKSKMQKKMEQDGITHHGRVGQEEIVEETYKSGIWAYPTHFYEISCWPDGTRIMTEDGEENIEDLGFTNVLTHKGRFKPITTLMRRKADKLINFEIQCGDDFSCTPEHPLYVLRDGEREFIEAKDVEESDMVIMPKVNVGHYNHSLDLSYNGRDNNLPTEENKIPDDIAIDDNFSWWLGYFAGDGTASSRTGKVSVLVADAHPEHIEPVLKGFNSFGLEPKTRELQGCVEYYVYSHKLARGLREGFYNGKKKTIPMKLINTRAFDGLMAADGTTNGYNYTFTNTSLYLIGFARAALANRGIATRTQRRVHKNGNVSYSLPWTEEKKVKFYDEDEDYLYRKIKNISHEDYAGWVYNLEVADDNSYVSNGHANHNCITAMKCQAAGAIPVVTDYAALKETVQHGVKLDVSEADIYEDKIKEEFVEKLIELMQDDDRQKEIREDMIPWAMDKFSWSHISKQWDKAFKEVDNGN